MLPLTNELQAKIREYAKNGIDISELIKDVNLSGADLSHCVIKHLVIVDQHLKNINFSYTTIGEEKGSPVNISGNKLSNITFKGTKFVTTIFFRRNECKNCNFSEAFVPYVEYQKTTFDAGCTFCSTVFRIGSREGLGAKFDVSFFRELAKYWGVKIVEEGK